MTNPEYVEVKGKKYKINTDFRVAIKCDKVARDKTISDDERALAIIYILFGEEALRDKQNHNELLQLALKYLSCGQEIDTSTDENPDMDYEEDYNYIWTSFKSDYNGFDLDKEKLHWWKFMDMLNGLSNSELGNCCVLNRVRQLRNLDLSTIKDTKERDRLAKAKKSVELKKYSKENNLTKEQEESMERLNKLLGL